MFLSTPNNKRPSAEDVDRFAESASSSFARTVQGLAATNFLPDHILLAKKADTIRTINQGRRGTNQRKPERKSDKVNTTAKLVLGAVALGAGILVARRFAPQLAQTIIPKAMSLLRGSASIARRESALTLKAVGEGLSTGKNFIVNGMRGLARIMTGGNMRPALASGMDDIGTAAASGAERSFIASVKNKATTLKEKLARPFRIEEEDGYEPLSGLRSTYKEVGGRPSFGAWENTAEITPSVKAPEQLVKAAKTTNMRPVAQARSLGKIKEDINRLGFYDWTRCFVFNRAGNKVAYTGTAVAAANFLVGFPLGPVAIPVALLSGAYLLASVYLRHPSRKELDKEEKFVRDKKTIAEAAKMFEPGGSPDRSHSFERKFRKIKLPKGEAEIQFNKAWEALYEYRTTSDGISYASENRHAHWKEIDIRLHAVLDILDHPEQAQKISQEADQRVKKECIIQTSMEW